jgi:uncharacterized integral membrane protein (TIGR00697 family)
MNELLFLIHILAALGFTLGALRLGKEALITWICLQAICANFFVLKQIVLCGFQVTCSDVFAVSGILSLNLLQEYYGQETAKKTLKTCFYFMIVFAAFSKLHLLYIPSAEDTMHAAYNTILSPAPRLLLASLFVFFLVQKIDINLFSKLQKRISSKSLRFFISLLTADLLDTVLFTLIGLYGMVASLTDIIVVSFILKAAAAALLTPTVWLAKRQTLLKQETL